MVKKTSGELQTTGRNKKELVSNNRNNVNNKNVTNIRNHKSHLLK